MKVCMSEDVQIYPFNGSKTSPMSRDEAKRSVLSLKVLAHQMVIVSRANSMDFDFSNSTTPEFPGFNIPSWRVSKTDTRPATRAVYRPLVNLTPSDPTTTMTAMVEAKHLVSQTGQAYAVFTADQQLYRVMINIIWAYPEMFDNFIPRLHGRYAHADELRWYEDALVQ